MWVLQWHKHSAVLKHLKTIANVIICVEREDCYPHKCQNWTFCTHSSKFYSQADVILLYDILNVVTKCATTATTIAISIL